MEFNHFLTSYMPNVNIGSKVHFENMLKESVLAEKLGYATVSIPEHHLINLLMMPSPLQMAVKIASITKKINIGGIDVETYILKFEKDKANGMVPVNKQSHLRPLATINQINKCVSILKSKPKIKRSMWSRRAQEYEAKISSGKIYDLAEVVRDLNKGDDIMIDQSYSERQLFEKAYDRLLTEFQIVIGSSLEDAQKKLDKALKRNLEKQAQKIEERPIKEEVINQEIAE